MGGRRRRLAGDGGRKGSRGRDEEGWRGRGYNECFLSFSSRRRGMHLRGQRLGVSRGEGKGGGGELKKRNKKREKIKRKEEEIDKR